MLGSALSMIGGLASGLLGMSANASLNSATRNWQTAMYYQDRDYNSPINQVKRLREAGINPQLAMSNGMMSNGSTTGVPSAPSTHPYDFSPVQQGVSQAAGLYQQGELQKAQIDQINAQADNQRIRNDYEAWNQYTQILDRLSGINKNTSEAKLLEKRLQELGIDLETRSEENRERISLMKVQRKLAASQAAYQSAQAQYQDIINKFAPDQQKILLSNLEKQGREIESAIRRNDSDSALAAANKALSESQKNGVEVDNSTKGRIAEYVVEKAYQEAEMLRDQRELNWIRENRENVGKGGNYAPNPINLHRTNVGYHRAHGSRH